jgi:hypothetical protein
MYGAAFERPIVLFVGLGFPRQINSATDAYQALSDMPRRDKDHAHESALNACRAAVAGDVEPETARGIVEAYARSRGMLLDEMLAPHVLAARDDLLGA